MEPPRTAKEALKRKAELKAALRVRARELAFELARTTGANYRNTLRQYQAAQSGQAYICENCAAVVPIGAECPYCELERKRCREIDAALNGVRLPAPGAK